MSLLAELQMKKQLLKSVQTIVTCIDGQRFQMCKDDTIVLPNNEYGFIVDTKPDNIPANVIDFLYLGSQDCCQLEVLQSYNIQNVLSIGVNAPVEYDFINYHFIRCLDLPETNITSILQESIRFIESCVKRGSNILVHCNAGVSRSSSVIIGYLMLTHFYSYKDAFDIVKSARPCIQPNPGFQNQLQALDSRSQC